MMRMSTDFLEFIRRNRLDQRHPLCTQNMSVTQVYCRLTIKPGNPMLAPRVVDVLVSPQGLDVLSGGLESPAGLLGRLGGAFGKDSSPCLRATKSAGSRLCIPASISNISVLQQSDGISGKSVSLFQFKARFTD
jgi:hypothetical protein